MSAGMEMTHEPLIPEGFKALSLEDREAVAGVWREDPPQTSELTFTNLFMWRGHYQPAWRMENDCLLVVASPAGRPPFGLPPHGRGDKARAGGTAPGSYGPGRPARGRTRRARPGGPLGGFSTLPVRTRSGPERLRLPDRKA